MVAGFIHPAIRYQSPSDSGELERCLWFLGPLLSYFAFAVSLPRCLASMAYVWDDCHICQHAAPDSYNDFLRLG